MESVKVLHGPRVVLNGRDPCVQVQRFVFSDTRGQAWPKGPGLDSTLDLGKESWGSRPLPIVRAINMGQVGDESLNVLRVLEKLRSKQGPLHVLEKSELQKT